MTLMVGTQYGRGTSNANSRGSSEARRRRRLWLIENYRANRDLLVVAGGPAGAYVMAVRRDHPDPLLLLLPEEIGQATLRPACRCYRCGTLLTVDTVTVDRIVPGRDGGTYRRNNIRPACAACNSETGGTMRRRTAS